MNHLVHFFLQNHWASDPVYFACLPDMPNGTGLWTPNLTWGFFFFFRWKMASSGTRKNHMVNMPYLHGEFGDTVQSTIPLRIVVRHEPSPFFRIWSSNLNTLQVYRKNRHGKKSERQFFLGKYILAKMVGFNQPARLVYGSVPRPCEHWLGTCGYSWRPSAPSFGLLQALGCDLVMASSHLWTPADGGKSPAMCMQMSWLSSIRWCKSKANSIALTGIWKLHFSHLLQSLYDLLVCERSLV